MKRMGAFCETPTGPVGLVAAAGAALAGRELARHDHELLTGLVGERLKVLLRVEVANLAGLLGHLLKELQRLLTLGKRLDPVGIGCWDPLAFGHLVERLLRKRRRVLLSDGTWHVLNLGGGGFFGRLWRA